MSWWIRYIKRIQLQSIYILNDNKRKLNSLVQLSGEKVQSNETPRKW